MSVKGVRWPVFLTLMICCPGLFQIERDVFHTFRVHIAR